jgi:hypothetical protein
VVAREDAVSNGEAGVGGDDAVVGACDGHAGPAEPNRHPRYEDEKTGDEAGVGGRTYPPLFS